MANHNTNYKIVPLIGTVDFTGATVVHEVYCITNGTVTVTAKGGGSMTVAFTTGQSINVLCSSVTVSSGSFVGFMSNNNGTLGAIRG